MSNQQEWSSDVLRFSAENPTSDIVKSSSLAAGYDLVCPMDISVLPGKRRLIPTGIRLAIPEGYFGMVLPRSGLSVNFGIETGAGVIDADYRGEIKVLLYNFGDEKVELKGGSRIAQIVIARIYAGKVVRTSKLPETKRGDQGFGSTGI